MYFGVTFFVKLIFSLINAYILCISIREGVNNHRLVYKNVTLILLMIFIYFHTFVITFL